ncbi:hypothetical protein AOQ84DRAFT_358417 [Glonium stellatum]|uniref:Uncharacterized protein n=1 Tax=Glonium stellatum TaxID=574774 RepID=A0A8E2JZ14_9PEZI|nr:hypothetical protein AOQ84DRAFT_358417 [Glonium stellatum]
MDPLEAEVWRLHRIINFWYALSNEPYAKAQSLRDICYGETMTRAQHYTYYEAEVDYAAEGPMDQPGNGGVIFMMPWMYEPRFELSNPRTDTICHVVTRLVDSDLDDDSKDLEEWDLRAMGIAYYFGMRVVRKVLRRLLLTTPSHTVVNDDDGEDFETTPLPR